ncbi:MAG: DUF4412 domain-containing protein [Candidatus Micrarchaeia archaeon]|jgi:hypothetical protein
MKGFLMIGIVCAMLLFGCASQGTPAAQAPPPSPPAAAAVAPPAPPAPAAETPNESKAETSPPPAPAASPSDALLGSLKASLGWKVVYDVTTSASGSYEMTQYLKGGNSRTDMAVSGMQVRTYMVSGKISSCALVEASWMCTDLSQAGAQSADLSQQLQSEEAKYTITLDGTEAVAGTTATCYKLVSSDGTARYCISSEGIPLYLKTGAEGAEITMKAKSYSTSVADSDFAMPT